MSHMRGPHVAHLEREAEAGASPPSLSASPGARVPSTPAGGIFTSPSPLKRESYRGRPREVGKVVHKPPPTRGVHPHRHPFAAWAGLFGAWAGSLRDPFAAFFKKLDGPARGWSRKVSSECNGAFAHLGLARTTAPIGIPTPCG